MVVSILNTYKIPKGVILDELRQDDFKFICSYYKVQQDELVLAFYPVITFSDQPRAGTVITNRRLISAFDGEFVADVNSISWFDLSLCIDDAVRSTISGLKLPNGVNLNIGEQKIFKQLITKLAPIYKNDSSIDLGLPPEYGDFNEDELKPLSGFERDAPSRAKWLKVLVILMIPVLFLGILNKCEGQASAVRLAPSLIPTAPAGAKVIDYWYDNIKDMESWNSVFMEYEVAGERYLIRRYVDGKQVVYYSTGSGYYIQRGRPNAHYTVTARGLEMSDKAGFIRMAKGINFID